LFPPSSSSSGLVASPQADGAGETRRPFEPLAGEILQCGAGSSSGVAGGVLGAGGRRGSLSEAAGGQADEAAGASLAARALPQDGGRSGRSRAPRLLQGELF
jgi:hypothetical protein